MRGLGGLLTDTSSTASTSTALVMLLAELRATGGPTALSVTLSQLHKGTTISTELLGASRLSELTQAEVGVCW